MGHINLRGRLSDPAFLKAVEVALEVVPPLDPNTVAEGPEIAALWLGPNEWLVLTPRYQQHKIAAALRSSLGDLFAAVTDVSGAQTVINIRGPRARDVLSKGCALDLHPRVFGPGHCAQTNLAKATAIIRQLDESPSYDIVVRRSFADYLARWLTDAAREYGLVVG
jgi:sarcosine oxidase subunit gamma